VSAGGWSGFIEEQIKMPIIAIDLLACDISQQQYCDAFNTYFNIIATFGVAMIPIMALLRLVSRA
jgi:hypothetical protein